MTPDPPITDPNIVTKKRKEETQISVIIISLVRAWHWGLEYSPMKFR